MASRKKLKNTLNFISSELITDIYFRCLMSGKMDEKVVDKLVVEIMDLNREFVLRANRPDGKENPKLVKAYYSKLFADWQLKTSEIIAKIEKL